MSIIDAVRGLVGSEDPAATAMRALPFGVLHALRAGAAIGRVFTAEEVAALLEVSPLAALERLQRAVDLEVPLADLAGEFTLPEAWQATLVASTLPSLTRAWRVRLAERAAAREVSEGTGAGGAVEAGSAGGAVAVEVSGGTGSADAAGDAARAAEAEVAGPTAVSGGVSAGTGAEEEKGSVDGAVKVSAGTGAEEEKGSVDGAVEVSFGTGAEDGKAGGDEVKVSAGTGAEEEKGSVDGAVEVSVGTGAEGEKAGGDEVKVSVGTGAEGEKASGDGAEKVSVGTGTEDGAEKVSAGTGAEAGGDVAENVSAGTGAEDGKQGGDGAGSEAAGADGVDGGVMLIVSIGDLSEGAGEAAGEDEALEIDEAMFVRTEPTEAGPRAGLRPPPPHRARRKEPLGPPRLEDDTQPGGALNLDFLAAAQEAMDRGAPQIAAGHLQRALGELASQSPAHQRLRILGLIALGKLQWRAAGPEQGFTLVEALRTLEAAREELGSDAPSDLAVDLCQAIAGVCVDVGDLPSLERALAELAVASRLLAASGDTTRVARLLNEQAAVLVLLGDAGRATQLLRESRKVFQGRESDDPVAQRELAETDHLMAWLPLYAQLRAGREQDGYRMGLEHAAAAEKVFRRLEDVRELARVWETTGRLELRLDRHDAAIEHLSAAVEAQRGVGDLTGLARTADALAEALSLVGRVEEAIVLLLESIGCNREKGSPLGLAFNRQTFTNFAVRFGAGEHGAALQEVGLLLARCERELDVIRRHAVR